MLDGLILCEVDSVFVALLLLEFCGVRFFDYIARAGSMQSALAISMYVCLFHTYAKASSNTHSCTQYAVFYISSKRPSNLSSCSGRGKSSPRPSVPLCCAHIGEIGRTKVSGNRQFASLFKSLTIAFSPTFFRSNSCSGTTTTSDAVIKANQTKPNQSK